MSVIPKTAILILVGASLVWYSSGDENKGMRTPARAEVVATIGDTAVTSAELEEMVKERLYRIRSEEYNIKRQALEEYVFRTLMEKEAKSRGISVGQLQESEIDDKVLAVTDDQKRAVYEASPPQQYAGKSETEAFAIIQVNLKRIRIAEARNRFVTSLRQKTPVKIMLSAPRLAIPTGDHPTRGPAKAPVTIVEFSDFQCPACARALPAVKMVLAQFGDKVRLVFRDLPLPMHPQAPKAAEAGACAGEQGKFWEMHDRMFLNQQRLSVDDLKSAAGELGMDSARFASCLDSGMYQMDWKSDVAEARKLGISATPTFFVNGRMINGAPTYENFAKVIEEELQLAPGGSQ